MSRFRFDYKSPEELEPKKVDLTPGEASFKVSAVFDTKKDGSPLTTMNGDPKLTISFSCIDVDGNQGLIYDDITPKMAWKIKTLLDAINMGHLYDESGQFSPEDILGCTGRCMIELKKSEGYADRMAIKKYMKFGAGKAVKTDYSKPLDELNDQIPF